MEAAHGLDWLRPLAHRVEKLVRDYGFDYFRRHVHEWSSNYQQAIEVRNEWRKKRQDYAAQHPADTETPDTEAVEVYEYADDGVATSARDVLCVLPDEFRHRKEPKLPLRLPIVKDDDPTAGEKFVILSAIRDALVDGEKIETFPMLGEPIDEARRRRAYAITTKLIGDYLYPDQLHRLVRWCDEIEQELIGLQLPWLSGWAHRLSDAWQSFAEEKINDENWHALNQAVGRGWVELRLELRFWRLPYVRAQNARCVVSGSWGGALGLDAPIRKAIPEWSKDVIEVRIGRKLEARLTPKGLATFRRLNISDDHARLDALSSTSNYEAGRIELELLNDRKAILEVSTRFHELTGLDAADWSQECGGTGLVKQCNESARRLRIAIKDADRFLNRGISRPVPVVAFVSSHRSEPVTIGKITATCYVEASWDLFITMHTAIYAALGSNSRSIYEPLDFTAEQIADCGKVIQKSIGDEQDLEFVLAQIERGATLEITKAKQQTDIPDDLAELDWAVFALCAHMKDFVARLRGVQANLKGLIPSERQILMPPGWSRPVVPSNICELAEWFQEHVGHYRDFPKNNPTYMRVVSESNSDNAKFVQREPDPGMVKLRLWLGQDAIQQVHYWLEDRGYFDQPNRPSKYDVEAEVDHELSKLLTFLVRKGAASGGGTLEAGLIVEQQKITESARTTRVIAIESGERVDTGVGVPDIPKTTELVDLFRDAVQAVKCYLTDKARQRTSGWEGWPLAELQHAYGVTKAHRAHIEQAAGKQDGWLNSLLEDLQRAKHAEQGDCFVVARNLDDYEQVLFRVRNQVLREAVDESTSDRTDLDAKNDTVAPVNEQVLELPLSAGNGPPAISVNEFELYLHGETYVVAGFGESGIVRDMKGFEYIRRLVATPKQPISMLDLCGASEDIRIKSDGRSKQETLDSAARNELRDRLVELQGELNKAEEWNDDVRAEALRVELDELKEHAANAIGLRGRSRDLNNPLEKLRPKLLGALKRAYAVLRNAKMPTIAEHLESSISSANGTLVYAPAGLEISWQIVKQ